MVLEKVKTNDGKRFTDIGLENVAVVAKRVVELPSRCSNKGGRGSKVSMFIKRLQESFLAPTPRRARSTDLHQPLNCQSPTRASSAWGELMVII